MGEVRYKSIEEFAKVVAPLLGNLERYRKVCAEAGNCNTAVLTLIVDHEYLTLKDIERMTGYRKSQLYESLKKLQKLDLIRKDRGGYRPA